MHFEPNHIYHVYNRGNNKTPIFFNSENYLFLLRKVRKEWLAYCDIFCYCLMPTHFHFMLQAKPGGCNTIILKERETHLQHLSKTIGKTLSSYTQAINIQNKTTGNLFQKKTKAKCLTDLPVDTSGFFATDYLLNCFHYIHLNPLTAGLVKNLRDWPYSSWPDYYGHRDGSLCNKEIVVKRLDVSIPDLTPPNDFVLNQKIIEGLW